MAPIMFDREIQIRQGSYLPHWTKEGAKYHVRLRLVDSLPQKKLSLYTWCIMPNHVHVLVEPVNHDLSKILNSWKTFTARETNKLLGREGKPFWQREYFDHLVRNQEHLEQTHAYIWNNPEVAGLKNWKWRWRMEGEV